MARALIENDIYMTKDICKKDTFYAIKAHVETRARLALNKVCDLKFDTYNRLCCDTHSIIYSTQSITQTAFGTRYSTPSKFFNTLKNTQSTKKKIKSIYMYIPSIFFKVSELYLYN